MLTHGVLTSDHTGHGLSEDHILEVVLGHCDQHEPGRTVRILLHLPVQLFENLANLLLLRLPSQTNEINEFKKGRARNAALTLLYR